MNTDTLVNQPSDRSLVFQFFNGYRNERNSPFNTWVTGEAVGHSPTQVEKLLHSIGHGGLRDYRKRFRLAHSEVPLVA